VAKPAGSDAASRLASAQQAEERRKAATRKLFARLRSLEAIVGADLRKRGSLLLSQAVDQWYAEAISATASDVTITNAARAVISQL
jgi:endonuclease III